MDLIVCSARAHDGDFLFPCYAAREVPSGSVGDGNLDAGTGVGE